MKNVIQKTKVPNTQESDIEEEEQKSQDGEPEGVTTSEMAVLLTIVMKKFALINKDELKNKTISTLTKEVLSEVEAFCESLPE